jgi:hypothetical protein
MKILTRCFVALLAVSTLMALSLRPTYAQGGLQKGMGGAPAGAPQVPPALQKDVQDLQKMAADFQKTITPDQKKKMQTLQEKYTKLSQGIIDPYKKKYGSTPSDADKQKIMKELAPKMKKLQEDGAKEMKTILKPNQVTKMNQMEAKQKALQAKAMAMQKSGK